MLLASSSRRNPFLGQTVMINTDRYLAGGNFGPFVSRNLTPDRNGIREI